MFKEGVKAKNSKKAKTSNGLSELLFYLMSTTNIHVYRYLFGLVPYSFSVFSYQHHFYLHNNINALFCVCLWLFLQINNNNKNSVKKPSAASTSIKIKTTQPASTSI
jgi:hypothetical protein